MAKKSYKLNDNDVNFYVKPEITFSVGNKVIYSDYVVNESGDITWHKPVINAIDIDWQNAVTDEITDAINTSGKLISIISDNKKSIRLTNEAIDSIIEQITAIENALDIINDLFVNIDDLLALSELRESLQSLSTEINNVKNGHASDIRNIQNSITSINNRINNLSIPRYVNDLEDGADVLRQSQFENIKDQLKGDPGESAYDIAKRIAQQNDTPFPYANEREWIESLKGKDGESAYDIAKRTAQTLGREFPYENEVEWMTTIINGNETKSYTDQKINELRTEIDNNKLIAGNGINIENNVISAGANTWIKI